MSNWDFVAAYDREASEWLAAQGYPHPAPLPGNRFPTPAEIVAATVTIGLAPDAPLVVDFEGREGYFVMKGDLGLELSLLQALSRVAGQLWVYPDTGLPAIVVEPTSDLLVLAQLWRASLELPDPWLFFYVQLYGKSAAT